MTHSLQVFQNEDFGSVRTLEEDGKVLFCGKDVALALGYSKPRNAIASICKGALKRGVLTNGGEQEMTFIPEGDLFRLITHSRLPEAQKFERWVFEEVLPDIRKHGAYIPDREQMMNSAAEEMLQAMQQKLEQLEETQERRTANMVGQVIEQLLPRLIRWNTDPQYQRKQPYSSLVYALSPNLRQEIEDMLLIHHVAYDEISKYLYKQYGIEISKSAIGRYAIYLRGKVYDRKKGKRSA